MSAKHSKKSAKKNVARPASATPAPVSAASGVNPMPAATAVPATAGATDTATPWIESADPRKRTIGKFVLIGVWIYVAALWLLALDQTFHWGIFGPKVPPVP